MPSLSSRSPRRRLSFPRLVAVMSVLILLGWGALVGLQALFYPWGRSLGGGPTLTGRWLGELVTPTDTRQVVWLDMVLPYQSCANCPKIDGEASVCDGRGSVLQHSLSGNVADRSGEQFTLRLTERKEGAAALRLTFIDGRWSGDRLDLTTTLIAPGQPTTMRIEKDAAGREMTTVVGGHPDTRAPITFTMRRATPAEFAAACAKLDPAARRP